MPKDPELKKEIEILVNKAQYGDNEAFGKIYDIYVDEIYKYVFFRVSDAKDAEDLTESVFMKAWEHLDQYKNTKQSFGSWVFRIAHNLVVDHYKFNKRLEEITEDYIDERREHSPLNHAEKAVDSTILRRALSQLKEKYRQVIVLKYINDFSNEEIANILKKNESSVRLLQFRALQYLKKIFEEMGIKEYHL